MECAGRVGGSVAGNGILTRLQWGGFGRITFVRPEPPCPALVEPLQTGIAKMEADPEKYEQLNSANGWGLYKNFVPWLKRYLAACEEHPYAFVSVTR